MRSQRYLFMRGLCRTSSHLFSKSESRQVAIYVNWVSIFSVFSICWNRLKETVYFCDNFFQIIFCYQGMQSFTQTNKPWYIDSCEKMDDKLSKANDFFLKGNQVALRMIK